MKLFLIILFNLFLPVLSFGAACCGGGFAAPSLIVGDDRAQVTATYSLTRVTDDVGADGLWTKRATSENDETLKIEAAHIFWDRYQAGVTVPVVKRTRAEESSSGLGDVAGTVGYEYLPDWDYNVWRPKGVGFFQLTLPTGRSLNEADGPEQLDARGRGFLALGIGTILTKTLGRWDVQTNFNVHRSFERSIDNGRIQGTLKPGFGGEAGFGAGYNGARWRLGGSMTWTSEDPVALEGSIRSEGGAQRFVTASLAANYMFSEEWAGTIAYSDQMAFGDPVNANLGRGMALLIQRRWMR